MGLKRVRSIRLKVSKIGMLSDAVAYLNEITQSLSQVKPQNDDR